MSARNSPLYVNEQLVGEYFQNFARSPPHAEPIGKLQWDGFSNFIEQANEYCTTPVWNHAH